MSLAGRHIVLTGGTGWLGRGLLAALDHGLPDCPRWSEPARAARVRLLAPASEDLPEEACGDGIEVVRGDVRSASDCRDLFAGTDSALVLHLAGLIHPHRVHELHEVNVEGTRNVLEAAAAAGSERAVVLSSNSPLGCNPHPDHLFDEDSPYQPYMAYGRSKMELEKTARRIEETLGLPTVLIRAPWFYGPRQPARQTAFFTMIRDGHAPLLGGGENRRSMTYIDNLVQGLFLAATVARAAGRTYWIADERPYSTKEIVDTVEGLLENEFGQTCTHRRLRLPYAVGDVAELADWTLQGVGLYHQKIHVLSEMNKTIACSVARACEELGYAPAVSLEEGMRRSLAWLAGHGGLGV